MVKISTIFLAVCTVLIAASVGIGLYGLLNLSGFESAIVALATLTFLILYHTVAIRLREQPDVNVQIADLSRGTAELARQVAEIGRRLVSVEQRMNTPSDATQPQSELRPLMSELNELGSLVRQLAVTVASHEQMMSSVRSETKPSTPRTTTNPLDKAATRSHSTVDAPAPAPQTDIGSGLAALAHHQTTPEAIQEAINANRIDLFLQPIVTLPQRKVRYYEAVARLREGNEQVVAASQFIRVAEAAGLLAKIDQLVLFRCIQALRRLMVRSKDIGIFCNIATSTLSDPVMFPQCFEFLEANRALAPSFILEFTQSAFRKLGPIEIENLASISKYGYGLSIDNVTDLKMDPRELAERGVRFVKIPSALLLDKGQNNASGIHPAELSDLLGRYGIDLIAERIEGERAVVDLLDFDVRYGQGFLFSPPRPVRPDQPSYFAKSDETPPQATDTTRTDTKPDPALTRTGGVAALVRRIASPN